MTAGEHLNESFQIEEKDVTEKTPAKDNGGGNTAKPAEFEDILEEVGNFGVYQLLMFLLLSSTDFGAGMSMLYFIFSNYVPEWRCVLYEANLTFGELGGNSSDEWKLNMDNCVLQGNKCVQFEFRGAVSIVTEWNLLCDKMYVPKLTTSCQFCGLIVGAAVFGQLSDTFGRRKIGLVTQTGMALSQVLVGLSPNWYLFAFFRFMVGVFTAGVLGIFCVYPQEFVGPRWRPCVASVGFFSIGHCVMSFMAMWLKDSWHLAYAVALLPAPFLILIAIFCPESPRWLIQKRRFKEAEDVIKRMAKSNGKPLPDMSILPRIAQTEMARESVKRTLSYRELFRGPIMIRRSIVVCILWFAVSEIYYGIVTMVNTFQGSVYMNSVYSALSTYPLVWLSIPIVTWIGRKKVFVLFTFLTVGSLLSIVFLNVAGVLEQASGVVTALSLFGKGAVVALWTTTSLMTIEIYPTLLRNIGTGMGNAMARAGGMLSPQFLLLGMYTHWTVPYIIHASLGLLGAVLAFVILPETGAQPLTEDVPYHQAEPTDDHQLHEIQRPINHPQQLGKVNQSCS